MERPIRKIAFVSPHCVLDFTNGAATATLDGLTLLARSSFECQAFCSSRMDAWEEVFVEDILARRRVRYLVRNAKIGAHRARMIFTTHGQVPVTIFSSVSSRGGWVNAEEVAAFLTACEIFLTRNRPDVVWTYGGDPVSQALHRLVKRLGIAIVFGLHNFNYRDAGVFQMVDHVIVPTEFARRFYRETIGLNCHFLPLVMDWERVRVEGRLEPNPLPENGDQMESGNKLPHSKIPLPEGDANKLPSPPAPHPGHHVPMVAGEGRIAPQYVTFVNPEPRKGVHVFARIADVLARRRPDIPVLLVEGAARTNVLAQPGIDFGCLKNVKIMPNTPDPREFYAVTRLILMPSLMENAGFVAMEAMTNGIPVLASNRGGLPETIGGSPHPGPLPQAGEGGILFDIPAKYTPETREVPTAEEVEPWVETIIRLWDDAAEYERWSRAARERAQLWHPDRLAPLYREFFGSITHQPGPPLVPRELTAHGRLHDAE